MVTVSVVLPTYQRPEYLTNCLKALLQQKFDKKDFEIIVVSDGPDEQTKKTTDEWAGYDYPAIRYLPLPYKKGPAAARNYGWLNARGRIVAFTDDDCIPDGHWLHEMVANCDPKQDVALTGKVIVPIGKRPTDFEQTTAGLQTADFITANCACTKNALIKAGGFDEQFSMAWREDSTVWGVSIKEQKKTMYNALLYKKHPQLYRKKISQKSPVLYYSIIASFLMFAAGLVTTHNSLILAGSAGWLGLTGYFILKRLYVTKLSLKHIAEMVVTSFAIPFVSVFWQWYGAVKYRVLFI
jgi:glycosyltransferase involved in cell wall biosynthesis